MDEICVLRFKAQLLSEISTNKGFIYNCTKNECEIVNLQLIQPPPSRIGDSIDAKSFKEIVKMAFALFWYIFDHMDKEENEEPKCSELGNEVEGARQSEKRSKILTEPEHQHEQPADKVKQLQHPTV